ncbi:molybdopterin molybdotransferase MoeA [Phormidium tenue FACHB-886]|nr:molybdopterin molybdotransferase MoeA [Phormidium tenue FACHB-886]
MLPAQEAEALILDLVQPFNSQHEGEVVALRSALGRILATPVIGAIDFPHWDNSAMDGYAVRYEDVKDCSPAAPVTLTIAEEIPAGYQPQKTIQTGETARILTGSMLPAGADTIVIQENTRREGDRVTVLAAPAPNAFVRRRAEYYEAGTPLLAAGTLLAAPEIAVLATAQCTEVPVYRRLRVALFSTGSELISPDQRLQPGQIVDSNQYALAALVAQTGAEPVALGIVPDQPSALQSAIAEAIGTADVVLSSGGVSVGDYDYVDRILAELGAEIHIRAVAIKPGKPLTVATFENADASQRPILYFGLPGNPVSALVTFWRFVQPALRKLSGLKESWQPTTVQGRTRQLLRSDGKRETYLWGRVYLINGAYEFELAGGSHSSGNLINLAQTNGLAVLSIGQTEVAEGKSVPIMLVGAPIMARN